MSNKNIIVLLLLAIINASAVIAFFYFNEHVGALLQSLPMLLVLSTCAMILLLLISLFKQNNSSHGKSNTAEGELTGLLDYVYNDLFLVEMLPTILCIKDASGRWLKAKKKYRELLAIEQDYYGKTDEQLVDTASENAQILMANAQLEARAWQQKKSLNEYIKVKALDGNIRHIKLSVSPCFHNNKPFRMITSGQFIHKSEVEKHRLFLMDALFQNSHLSFILLDEQLNIIKINRAFSSMTGFSKEDIIGKSFSVLNASKKQDLVDKILLSFKDDDFDLWVGEILCLNRHKGESLILAKLEVTRIINQKNSTISFFASLIDITRQRKNERHIMQIAHYDTLTGLANRVMFLNRLSQALSEAKRANKHSILFFIDLDKFKAVNDSLGHEAGDAVLKETAKRLLAITRKEDVVARFSGDEFAILLVNEDSHEQALYITSIIAKKILNSTSQAYYFQTREIFIGSSIGITIYPEDGSSSEQLLKNSDIAMYQAKNLGRNNYQYYKKEYSSVVKDRLTLENKLRKALEKDELCLYYQPQYSSKQRKIFGAEVLIRWFVNDDGLKKMISPDSFIPIAEDSGLIISIGKWIILTACQQMKRWQNEGLSIDQVSVNVSARQFLDSGFMDSVAEGLQQANLAPEHLELEITESMLIGDTKRIELQLNRLKKMGIKVALDDFGTGYSSLSYLKKFPIDVLKIDQSFVKDMIEDPKNQKIVRAIIEMGHSLDQKIVAEGVENNEQLLYLERHNCDIIQGYYFSKPLPAHEMTSFLTSNPNISSFV